MLSLVSLLLVLFWWKYTFSPYILGVISFWSLNWFCTYLSPWFYSTMRLFLILLKFILLLLIYILANYLGYCLLYQTCLFTIIFPTCHTSNQSHSFFYQLCSSFFQPSFFFTWSSLVSTPMNQTHSRYFIILFFNKRKIIVSHTWCIHIMYTLSY